MSEVNQKNELQVQRQQLSAPASIQDTISIAKAFYESGMFPDTKSQAAAIVKIQAGAEVGIKPFAAMTGIHIIQGKPVIGAGIIASRIKASPKYDYKIITMTDALCSIDFYEGKEKAGNSSFSIEDAKKANTQNITKFPRNMLFARAISNGVKWYAADVFDGPVYVHEEFDGGLTVDTSANVSTATTGEAATATKPTMIISEPKTTAPTAPTSEKSKEQLDEQKPFVIPGLWYAKLEKCKTAKDVLDLYQKNKETIDAHPELQALLKETQQNLKTKTAA